MGSVCSPCGRSTQTDAVSSLPRNTGSSSFSKVDMMEFGFTWKLEERRGDSHFLGELQRDLAMTYYWSGEWCRDYLFFIANWHPLVGMFCSHPVHPWSKRERLATFIFSVGFSLLPAAILAIMENESDNKMMVHIASGMVFVFITLPIMLWELALYWIAVADSFCVGRCNQVVQVVVCCQKLLLSCSVFTAIVSAALSCAIVAVSSASLDRLVTGVCTSRVQSWLTWFLLMTFLPCIGFVHGWRMEQRAAGKNFRSTAPEDTARTPEVVGAK